MSFGVFTDMTTSSALKRFNKRFQATVADSLNRTLEAVARDVELRVPRETGELASSLEVEHAQAAGQSIVASISIGGEGMDPAAVEFGTAEMLARPFFRPSVNHAIPAARSDMITSIRTAIQ